MAPTSEELVELFERGELASQMARRFGASGRMDTHVIEERCVDLHNAGTIDLLALVEGNAIQKLDSSDFFMASHFFCQLLEPNQNPMMPPSIAISSSEKMIALTRIKSSMFCTR